MPPGITIVGLGPAGVDMMTHEAWRVLLEAGEVFLRTDRHPAVGELPAELKISTFDELYSTSDDFLSVYETIIERLVSLAERPQGVVYAVPGDPTVGEATVTGLRSAAEARGLSFRIVHGLSFIEPCLAALGADALDGLHVADAFSLATRNHPPFPPDTPALVGQVHSRLVAAEVKLTLMNQYPDDHAAVLIHSAGSMEPELEKLRLFEIDQSSLIGGTTSLFVAPLDETSSFETLQNTIARLRAPDGCPWDREQTHQSLRSHLLEEAYEALQALDRNEFDELKEELGDLLIQVVLHAQIAVEAGEFSMAEVLSGINRKVIDRHPHVFGDLRLEDVDQVLHNWEQLKAVERGAKGEEKGVMDGVPVELPALAQAYELQLRAARVGFDWQDVQGVLAKVREEIQELDDAGSPEERSAELGDLFFAMVNYARWLEVDPEAALRQANQRFRFRFSRIEAAARAQGRPLKEWTLKELEDRWQASKGEAG